MYTHPGPRIRQYIENNGIKKKYVSEAAGIPLSAFSQMCQGRQKITVQQYFTICDVLNVTPQEFLPPVDIGKTG